jgi:hypothetical protein
MQIMNGKERLVKHAGLSKQTGSSGQNTFSPGAKVSKKMAQKPGQSKPQPIKEQQSLYSATFKLAALQVESWEWLRKGAYVASVLMLALLLLAAPVDAAKKKKKGDAELEKALEPVVKVIDDLTVKADARVIFSPKDYSEMMKVKFQLVDLMQDNASNAAMAKPMFQTAFIMASREQFSDAFELYNYIVTNYATSPYAGQAKSELYKMKRLLGEEEFKALTDASAPAADATAKPEKK